MVEGAGKSPLIFPQSWEISKSLITEREPVEYITRLMVIFPEHAQRIGISAEVPVFVASNDNKAHLCEGCGRNSAPPIYQTRYITEDLHSKCEGKPKTSFSFDTPGRMFDADYYRSEGSPWELDMDQWVASVEPMGKVKVSTGQDSYGNHYVFRSAERLLVKDIFLVCRKNGAIISSGNLYRDTQDPEFKLFESCGDKDHRDYDKYWKDKKPDYRFIAKGGQVFFFV